MHRFFPWYVPDTHSTIPAALAVCLLNTVHLAVYTAVVTAVVRFVA